MMLIVGERINTSRKEIREAVEKKDAAFIFNSAKRQVDSGARFVDVNCGTNVDTELDDLIWMIKTIQKDEAIPLCVDSPNVEVIKEALKIVKGKAMINSITAEKARYENILPFLRESDADIIALTMDEKGMPNTKEERFELATIIMEICQEYGISKDRLYFDPLVRPVATEQNQAVEVLGSIKMMADLNLKTIMGLSNISYGLPNRRLINRTFLSMSCASGLSGCIIDPLDMNMMSAVRASEAIIGNDEYAMRYITAFRENKLTV